ncbi:MAG: MucB/RseB C-terminal domain-containing protein [Pseudomonadales bacterium]|nr:MucB/RseB C-terminal domain-containing protein [Pseudomonadales bacterium]
MNIFRKAGLTGLLAFFLSSSPVIVAETIPTKTDVVARSASDWLAMMDTALREQNYTGTFVFARGSHFETIEIVHQFKAGEETERLTSLNGEEREIIRANGETVCYHVDSEHLDLSHAMPMGPFSHSFREKLSINERMYNVTAHGSERIAGHDAMRIAISPLNADRYGYRLWIDVKTGLLLKSNLVSHGRVLEFFQFSSVTIGDEIAPSKLLASLSGNTVQHTLSFLEQKIARQNAVKHDWRVAWVPNGFRRVRAVAENSMSFTDGIATISVFVESTPKSSLGNTQALIGGTVVITRHVKGTSQQITVVGEVPMETAKKVAESIEPVIY